MRNLQLWLERQTPWPVPGVNERPFLCPVDGNVFCITNDGSCSLLSSAGTWQTLASLASLAEELELGSSISVVAAEYITECHSVSVVLFSGEIIMYPLPSSESSSSPNAETDANTPECVGCITEGIHAMAWSPDQELVVFGTGAGTLVTMTKEWDILVENAAMPGLSGDFHAVNIRWRYDGQLFAVACTSESDTSNHRITIWDRNGGFKCEAGADPTQQRKHPVGLPAPFVLRPGLSSVMEWFPDGSLLATVEWCTETQATRLAFCLPNGDVHGECLLGSGKHEVLDLRWNAVGTMHHAVLAVMVLPPDSKSPVIKLYSRSNYHWYSKMALHFEGTGALAITWDTEDSYLLRVASEKGLSSHHLMWTVSSGADILGVIDNDHIKVTALAKGVIPPPLAHFHFQLPQGQGIKSLAVTSGDVAAAALTSSGDVYFFTSSCLAKPHPFQHPVASSFQLSAPDLFRQARLLTVIPFRNAVAFTTSSQPAVHILFYTAGDHVTVDSVVTFSMQSPVVAISYDEAAGRLLVQDSGGRVFAIPDLLFSQAPKGGSVPKLPASSITLSDVCPMMVPLGQTSGQGVVVVALSRRGTLCLNEIVVAPHVTAFAIFQRLFLIYTTSGNMLTIRLLDSRGMLLPTEQFEWNREVERGARLICAVDPDTATPSAQPTSSPPEAKLVLQMPRGNLETVHPRPLMLSTVKGLLSRGAHAAAFTLLRRHRIDLNVVIDHSPYHFLNCARQFVKDMSISNLSLFISTVSDTDVIATSFPFYSSLPSVQTASEQTSEVQPKENDPWHGQGKTNGVCRCLRDVMSELDEQRYVQCIVGSYAQQNPPAYKEALAMLRRLRDDCTRNPRIAADEETTPAWEEGVDHLIFLAQNVNAIFDAALGAYDFAMALAVAGRSQKDPKEYLPFLRGLQSLPEVEARFRVDVHLGRPEQAMANALQCNGPEFEEQFFALTTSNDLYNHALQLLDLQNGLAVVDQDWRQTLRQRLLLLYGQWLEKQQAQPLQAAFAYMEAKDLQKALECFIQSGDIVMTFAVAQQLNTSPIETVVIARRISKVLLEKGRVEDAALVAKRYCSDSDGALQMLINAHSWTTALQMATECARYDLVITEIKPGVVADAEDRIHELQENIEQFKVLIQRLKDLKEKKRLQLLATPGDVAADPDQMSLASLDSRVSSTISSLRTGTKSLVSSRSQLSKSSKATSKATHEPSKRDRKKLGLKSGGQFEESNIKREIYTLIPKPSFLLQGVQATVKLLLFFASLAEAQQLQNLTDQLLQLCHGHSAEYMEDLGTMQGIVLPDYVVSPEEWSRRFSALLQDITATDWRVTVAAVNSTAVAN